MKGRIIMSRSSSKKRFDDKGRLLRTGEYQRSDGRYQYKYQDVKGVTRYLYSMRLTETDAIPKGKGPCVSLREMEKEHLRDKLNGIDPSGKKLTLCQLYEKQNKLRPNVKKKTIEGRKHLMSLLIQDEIGNMTIDKIKPSHTKEWAIRMQKKGTAYNSISNYKRSLKAAFHIALGDELIHNNPFDWNLKEVISKDTKPKIPLTKEQMENLLRFCSTDCVYKRYYNFIFVLLHTGLRISELCGLTVKDINFEKKCIDVNHQLLKDTDGYYINTPKTESGKKSNSYE